jgi:hypothetical protein
MAGIVQHGHLRLDAQEKVVKRHLEAVGEQGEGRQGGNGPASFDG